MYDERIRDLKERIAFQKEIITHDATYYYDYGRGDIRGSGKKVGPRGSDQTIKELEAELRKFEKLQAEEDARHQKRWEKRSNWENQEIEKIKLEIFDSQYKRYHRKSGFTRGIKKVLGKEPKWAAIKHDLLAGDLEMENIRKAVEQGKKYGTTRR